VNQSTGCVSVSVDFGRTARRSRRREENAQKEDENHIQQLREENDSEGRSLLLFWNNMTMKD